MVLSRTGDEIMTNWDVQLGTDGIHKLTQLAFSLGSNKAGWKTLTDGENVPFKNTKSIVIEGNASSRILQLASISEGMFSVRS